MAPQEVEAGRSTDMELVKSRPHTPIHDTGLSGPSHSPFPPLSQERHPDLLFSRKQDSPPLQVLFSHLPLHSQKQVGVLGGLRHPLLCSGDAFRF